MRSDKNTFSVVLPTYNEKDNIIPLIKAVLDAVPHTEIIVVDDDSPDETWKIVEEFSAGRKQIKLIRRIHKRGLVSALADGIAASSGDIIGWMDCDFSMPPERYVDLLAEIDKGHDMAVASRFVKDGGVEIITGSGDTITAFLLSKMLNTFIGIVLDSRYKDYTSGFIAVKREVLMDIPLRGDYGEYFIDLLYKAIRKGYSISEIPYVCRARRVGVSKTGTNLFQYFQKGIKYIWVTFRLRMSRIPKGRNTNG